MVRKLRRQRVLEAQVSRGQITAEVEKADGDQASGIRKQETDDRRREKASGGR